MRSLAPVWSNDAPDKRAARTKYHTRNGSTLGNDIQVDYFGIGLAQSDDKAFETAHVSRDLSKSAAMNS